MTIEQIGGTSFGRETWCVVGSSDREFVSGAEGCIPVSGSCIAEGETGARYSCGVDALFRAIGAPTMEPTQPSRQRVATSTQQPAPQQPLLPTPTQDPAKTPGATQAGWGLPGVPGVQNFMQDVASTFSQGFASLDEKAVQALNAVGTGMQQGAADVGQQLPQPGVEQPSWFSRNWPWLAGATFLIVGGVVVATVMTRGE